jgi:hypothetical protein
MHTVFTGGAAAAVVVLALAACSGPHDNDDVDVLDATSDTIDASDGSDATLADVPVDATGDAPSDVDASDATSPHAFPDLGAVDVSEGSGTDPACESVECEGALRCIDGRCTTGRLFAEPGSEPGSFVGAWVPVEGRRVDFAVVSDGSGAESWFALHDDTETALHTVFTPYEGVDPRVQVRASLFGGGFELDGVDALQPPHLAWLGALAPTELGAALAAIPLELGCRTDLEIAPVGFAALVFPWQMALKYVHADRAEVISTHAALSSCRYAYGEPPPADVSGARHLWLSNEAPLPHVFGFFPFNGDGAVELAADKLEGQSFGPCGSRCRGSCGADCTDVNCQKVGLTEVCLTDAEGDNTGDYVSGHVLSCGSAEGCLWHDECYDNCHRSHGCGTWTAAACRRGCDVVACADHGLETCTHWAQGAGPHEDQRIEYTYKDDGAVVFHDTTICPLPDEIFGVCHCELVFVDADGHAGQTDAVWCYYTQRAFCTRTYANANFPIPPDQDQPGMTEFWGCPGEGYLGGFFEPGAEIAGNPACVVEMQ